MGVHVLKLPSLEQVTKQDLGGEASTLVYPCRLSLRFVQTGGLHSWPI